MVMRGKRLMKKAMMIMRFGVLLNIIFAPILMTIMSEYAFESVSCIIISIL